MSERERMIAIPGSNRTVVPQAQLLGKADSTAKIRVSIYAIRNPHRPNAIGPFLERLSYSPPGKRRYLNPEECSARFGADRNDLKTITDWAKACSLKVIDSSVAKRRLPVEGSVAHINPAFGIELKDFEHPDTGRYRGREGKIYVTEDLGSVIEGVVGLDNCRAARTRCGRGQWSSVEVQSLKPKPQKKRGEGSAHASAPLVRNPVPGIFFPPQVGNLYDYPANLNGSGQNIVIFMNSPRSNSLARTLLKFVCLFWILLLSCLVSHAQAQPIVGDFNGDGKADVAEWNPSSRMWDVYLSCGDGLAPPVQWAGNPGTDGAVSVGDLNGDGKTDIFMWKESDHTWSVNLSTGQGFNPQSWTGMWGSDGVIHVADLNGDGKSDIVMWRNANQTWSVNISTGHGFDAESWTGAFGSDGPVNVGDLNGDGKADVFMWRDSDKVWTVNLSTGHGFKPEIWTGAWGSDGTIHVGDLNGDGKQDVFMWRDSDKVWTVNLSTGKGFNADIWKGDWGSDGPTFVADLNGDKKADVFMWRASDKVWTVNLSTGKGFNPNIWPGAWGSDGTINVADLNGDKRADVFMWRASDDTWSVNLSTGSGFNADSWLSGPAPVPTIKSLGADHTTLTTPDQSFVVRYSVGIPPGCQPQGSYTIFEANGQSQGAGNAPVDSSGSGSSEFSGYDLPLSIQLSFSCAAKSACTTPQVVKSGLLQIQGPPILKITGLQASGNGTTASAGGTLYVPIGTIVSLGWQVQNCITGCSVTLTALDGLNYSDTAFVKSNMPVSGGANGLAPSQTFTKYVLKASSAEGQDSKSIIVQLAPLAQSCPTCQWFYFKLAAPPGASTPECYVVSIWAKDEQTAQVQAQSKATNYTVTQISAADYYSSSTCQVE